MNPDLNTDNADAGLSASDHLKSGVQKACMAIIADDGLTAREKYTKLRKYLDAHQKLADDDLDDEDEDDEDDDDEEDDDGPSILQKHKRVQAQIAGRGDPATEAIALLLKLGKGQKRLTEDRRRRTAIKSMTFSEFKRRLRRGA